MTVEHAVYRLTGHPAAVLGLESRGVLRAGVAADVCVIDLDRLTVGPTEMADDLPGGGQRLHRTAVGFNAVIVNGVVTVRHDALTEDRGGGLLRR
jgi:N-acyl-D-aspartate/D-glutamate deacylase